MKPAVMQGPRRGTGVAAASGPVTGVVAVFNRQRGRRVSVRAVERLARAVLEEAGVTAELGLHLVGARRMAQVNWDYLGHTGSTDVITFDHGSTREHLHGEIFISLADAVAQAEVFGTNWPDELTRYVIHGVLHLRGYDDLQPEARRRMKREEERVLRWARRTGVALGPKAARTAGTLRRDGFPRVPVGGA